MHFCTTFVAICNIQNKIESIIGCGCIEVAVECSTEHTTTGCCKTSGQLWKSLTDSFLSVLLLILCSFDCQIWAIFHFGSPSPWEWIISVENLIMKKSHISGLAQIDSIDAGWILRVANFNFNYLRHFLINFKNSCGHFVANFLNFLKHPKLFEFAWFWRKLWALNQ